MIKPTHEFLEWIRSDRRLVGLLKRSRREILSWPSMLNTIFFKSTFKMHYQIINIIVHCIWQTEGLYYNILTLIRLWSWVYGRIETAVEVPSISPRSISPHRPYPLSAISPRSMSSGATPFRATSPRAIYSRAIPLRAISPGSIQPIHLKHMHVHRKCK